VCCGGKLISDQDRYPTARASQPSLVASDDLRDRMRPVSSSDSRQLLGSAHEMSVASSEMSELRMIERAELMWSKLLRVYGGCLGIRRR